jgi:DNA polymerase III subunit epsilon
VTWHVRAERVIDTLVLARRKHPGGHNTLDDLCARYGVDRSPPRSTRRAAPALPEAAVYAALIAVGLWVILDTGSQQGSNFFYLLFLPVIIAAVRQGFDGWANRAASRGNRGF